MLSFPLSLDLDWQSVSEHPALLGDVSERLRSWLLEANSLTARLKQGCTNLHVEILSERLAKTPKSEAVLFSSPSEIMWCREVILWCDGRPEVYAQSWIPESLQQMTKLGTTPLGEVLFQVPKWQRGDLEVARISSQLQELEQHLKVKDLSSESKVARRSIFSLNNVEMLVCEVFLMEPLAT